MAKESLIRYSKGDKISLGIAISKFNKKIDQLSSSNYDHLPEKISFNNMVDEINTRREFNKNINRIKSFLKEDAMNISDSEIGQPLTNWEKENFYNDIKEARRTIKKQLKDLEQGFGMGSKRFNELNDTLESFRNLDNLTASKFKRLKERASIYGTRSL